MTRNGGSDSRARRVRELQRRIRRPPSHRLLLALCLTVLLLVLLVNGLSTQVTGASSTNDPSPNAPLKGSPPLLTERNGELVSRQPNPRRRIALTFDDGPDPKWTPRVAATLRRLRAKATFFVLGGHTVRHPGLVRRLREQGFELGNHSFSHVDLAARPSWQRRLEVTLTETAVAGAAGVRPRVVRPPYSSTVAAVTDEQERALAEVARDGRVIALSELDGRDWARPGVGAIVRAASPRGRRGGVVLMHDGGGDRSQTVAALEQLVPRLRRRGFRFVTTSELAGIPHSAAELPASGAQQLRG